MIGAGPPRESYLDGGTLVEGALRSGCDAVHPGYGFLPENAAFAQACADAGLAFVGPGPEAIEAIGSKTRAREIVAGLGAPRRAGQRRGRLRAPGPPGGGADRLPGRREGGRRRGRASSATPRSTWSATSRIRATSRCSCSPTATARWSRLGERDCTVQRRYQKLVEDAPAPTVGPALRARLGALAVRIARSTGCRSAGTVEGLLVGDDFFFLEMNARLQVEHPVTEMTTWVDLVREQFRIAAGMPLGVAQQDVAIGGAAIECRINADAAHKGFMPSPRAITAYTEAAGPGVRVDSGVALGFAVPSFYDSLLAKLIVHADSREAATERMLAALEAFVIEGPDTVFVPPPPAALAPVAAGGDGAGPAGRPTLAEVDRGRAGGAR